MQVRYAVVKPAALFLTVLFSPAVSAQQPGDEVMGDIRPRGASRLAVLPDTTHLTLMQKIDIIAPMINDFLDAKPPQ
jgi:hypothetical protein